jgi:hypothetical protein
MVGEGVRRAANSKISRCSFCSSLRKFFLRRLAIERNDLAQSAMAAGVFAEVLAPTSALASIMREVCFGFRTVELF